MQRYLCPICRHQFQNSRRPQKKQNSLWKQYVWQRQTIGDLAQEEGHGRDWIRKQLDRATPQVLSHNPQPVITVIDATFFPEYGVMVARVPRLKQNIWWQEIIRETAEAYRLAHREIERLGYTLTAVVLDGRKGAPAVFRDIPIQLCQFHQMKTVTRYLTRRPQTPAGYELRQIMLLIPKSNQAALEERLHLWYLRWGEFISEKTYLFPGSKHWFYTHRRVRSAYRSMRTNLPYLYTYQEYPELNIPNTTNSLDGFFSRLKHLLNVHRGMTPERRRQLIDEILGKSS